MMQEAWTIPKLNKIYIVRYHEASKSNYNSEILVVFLHGKFRNLMILVPTINDGLDDEGNIL